LKLKDPASIEAPQASFHHHSYLHNHIVGLGHMSTSPPWVSVAI